MIFLSVFVGLYIRVWLLTNQVKKMHYTVNGISHNYYSMKVRWITQFLRLSFLRTVWATPMGLSWRTVYKWYEYSNWRYLLAFAVILTIWVSVSNHQMLYIFCLVLMPNGAVRAAHLLLHSFWFATPHVQHLKTLKLMEYSLCATEVLSQNFLNFLSTIWKWWQKLYVDG